MGESKPANVSLRRETASGKIRQGRRTTFFELLGVSALSYKKNKVVAKLHCHRRQTCFGRRPPLAASCQWAQVVRRQTTASGQDNREKEVEPVFRQLFRMQRFERNKQRRGFPKTGRGNAGRESHRDSALAILRRQVRSELPPCCKACSSTSGCDADDCSQSFWASGKARSFGFPRFSQQAFAPPKSLQEVVPRHCRGVASPARRFIKLGLTFCQAWRRHWKRDWKLRLPIPFLF